MRPAASYRAARRNSFRRVWRDGPWHAIKRKVRREVVLMDKKGLPVVDPKTKKVKTEWRMIERIQVLHGSMAQALQPA